MVGMPACVSHMEDFLVTTMLGRYLSSLYADELSDFCCFPNQESNNNNNTLSATN